MDQNLVLKLTFMRKLAQNHQNPVGNQDIHRIEALMAKRLVYFKLVRFYPLVYLFKAWRWTEIRTSFPLGGRGGGDFSQKE